MGNLRWYKRDPDAALVGMADLTLEETGAYNMVLDLIYSRAGELEDDDRHIAKILRVDIRVWRRIRARLVELGKLYPQGGRLHNRRADRELDAVQHRALLAAASGRKSGASRRLKARIINGSHERTFELSRIKKE